MLIHLAVMVAWSFTLQHALPNALQPQSAPTSADVGRGGADAQHAGIFALLPSQVGAVLLGSLGALGLILAAFGLYAIVALNVSRRVKEIAIRGALGATRGKILALVVRDVAAVVGMGLVLGLGIAIVATKPLAVFLVAELSTTDPLAFAGTALVLGGVSLLAGLGPARSATRASPVVAMRAE